MSSAQHVVVVRFGTVFPVDIGGALCDRGFRVTERSRLDDSLADWSRIEDPVLVIDCSRSAGTTERIVRTLVAQRHILNCPLILASTDPQRVNEILQRYFAICVPVRSPCTVDEVARALETVARARCRLGRKLPFYADPEPAAERRLNAAVAGLAERSAEPTEGDAATIVRSVFATLEGGAIDVSVLGGDTLLTPMTLTDLMAAGLAPHDEGLLELGRSFVGNLDRAGRRHVLRTTALVGRLMEALRLPPEHRELGAGAALLYGCGFGEHDPDLMRQPYLSRRHREVRGRLIEGLAASASVLAGTPAQGGVAEVIRCFGHIVSHETIAEFPAEIAQLGMIVFGAESVARICYQSGWWNPRHGHKVLQRLEAGWFGDMPPTLGSALAKIVASAVSERPRGFVVPRRIRTDARLLTLARAHRDLVVRSDERRIAVADLAPGMRLSRPLETFDGKRVLESDLLLDDDLIWRLWRLAAIRPLNGPVIVHAERPVDGSPVELGGVDVPEGLAAEIDAILARCQP